MPFSQFNLTLIYTMILSFSIEEVKKSSSMVYGKGISHVALNLIIIRYFL